MVQLDEIMPVMVEERTNQTKKETYSTFRTLILRVCIHCSFIAKLFPILCVQRTLALTIMCGHASSTYYIECCDCHFKQSTPHMLDMRVQNIAQIFYRNI